MTITSDDRIDGPLPGDGAETEFDFTFKVSEESDILVEFQAADGALTTLVLDTDYTVSLNADQVANPGGTVTYPASGTDYLLSTEALVITDAVPYTQPTDLENAGSFREQVIENSLDRLTRQIIKLKVQMSRFIKLPYDALDSSVVDLATDRADGFLGFDASGDLTVKATGMDASALTLTAYISTLIQSAITNASGFLTELGFSTYAKTLIDDTTASAARTTLGIPAANQANTDTYFTTAGTAPAFTLTPTSAIGAYAAGQMFLVKFNADGTTGSNTLNISAQGAVSLKEYDASLNKRHGVVKSGMVSLVEYDGTDMLILNPLRLEPLTGVRQTVQYGPVASGFPSFLPSTATGLTLTSENITTSAPFVVSAANGAGEGADRLGSATSNISWTGLTDASTCYLYVDVTSSGSLTTGHITTAPVYDSSEASASVTSGVHTFATDRMRMLVGNGSTAASGYWRVFVGECVTSGGNVTSSIEYAYNGRYVSAWTATLPSASTQTAFSHNLGTTEIHATPLLQARCTTTDGGYAVGDTITNMTTYSVSQSSAAAPVITSRNAGQIATCNTNAFLLVPKTGGAHVPTTLARWKYRFVVNRGW